MSEAMLWKNVKKVTALFCAAAVAASAAGCSTKKAGGSDVTEVKIWSQANGDKILTNELIDEWNKTTGKEKGIKIVYEVLTGNADQQIDVALQSGKAADIITGSNLEKRAGMGYLQAIDELEGGNEFLEKYKGEQALEQFKYNGHYYTVLSGTVICGLLYNKDMFKAAGIVDENGEAKPPKTYAEMREYAKKLTNTKKRQYGFIFPGKSTGTYWSFEVQWPMMASVGHDGFDINTGKYDYSGMAPILQTIMDMKNDGSCYPGIESIDADPARARFAEGNVGMKFGMHWDVSVLTEQFPAKCDWGVAPVPVIDENHRYKQKKEVWGGAAMPKISKDKDADKIFTVYKWYMGEEFKRKLYENGIEIPWNEDIIKGAKVKKSVAPQWAEFAKLSAISATPPIACKTDTTEATPISELFLKDVWNGGDKNIDKLLKSWTDTLNKGMETYKERNPDYDYSQFDNSHFNPSM